uniref:C-type lectin domain-containing protein n=1 Tax=Cyprinus carpio TaxID=7962 RepID=A0A8C1GU20_CYPCA
MRNTTHSAVAFSGCDRKHTTLFNYINIWMDCYQSSLYYMSNETKSWTESRRYCTERGADMIIKNKREEHDLVMKMSDGNILNIGVTDIDAEGRWKWVDGSTLTSGLWDSGEPNGYRRENCVLIVNHEPRWPTLFRWHDVECNRDFQWICEKRFSQLTLPYRNITYILDSFKVQQYTKCL